MDTMWKSTGIWVEISMMNYILAYMVLFKMLFAEFAGMLSLMGLLIFSQGQSKFLAAQRVENDCD